jgi:glutamate racemase
VNRNPIGVFDSGVGGLTVVAEIRQLLSYDDIVYYADTANFPYGQKTVAELRLLAADATRFLISEKAKLVVVACNTASSAALSALRQQFPLPFVGMVPAVKPASAATRTGKVGVIATEATFQAEVFADLIAQFAQGVRVFTKACPSLAELVERGETNSPEIRRLLHLYLDPLLAEGIDVLVLGCTHYPFLRTAIESVVGNGVTVIDTGLPVARQVVRVIEAHDLATDSHQPGKLTYFASGDKEGFMTVVRMLCSQQVATPL